MSSDNKELGHMPKTFGLWSALSLGWLTVNAFGGISFILFVGLNAGGVPTILYGYIGSTAAVLCIILTFAQCASRFATAGGAYHYACFLTPEKYRRQVAYPLGWLKYLGWVFTHAACCAIVATCTLALVNLCQPDFDVNTRWQKFLVYLAVDILCWALNLYGLKGIATMELLGCYATALGFVGYTIALLVMAPKADVKFVFVETTNATGYSSTSLAILLGLLNSFATLMGLDGPAHLAEEIPQPKKALPRILLIVLASQFVVGVVWILALGFSITDLDAITSTTTGVPVLELIRKATGSDASAIIFCILLMVNNGTSALGSGVAMSRQGFAFAHDGGLFFDSKLTELSSKSHLPFWSINLPSALVALIGLIYLLSDQAYNAIIGSQAVCMIISFGFPALMLLVTNSELLHHSDDWNFGIWSKPIYLVSVGYSVTVILVAFIPQSHPVTKGNMNYTILVISAFAIAMTLAWLLEGRKLFSPPLNDEAIVNHTASVVTEGVCIDVENNSSVDIAKSGYQVQAKSSASEC